jgi:PadR family transcriptional regulator, regulatory protein PadR
MIGRSAYKNRVECLQGTLDMLILKTLQWGPNHGYGIVQALQTNSGEVLHSETGSPNPALYRLERREWVRSEWNRRRATSAPSHRITAAGKKQSASDLGRWQRIVEAMASIMDR